MERTALRKQRSNITEEALRDHNLNMNARGGGGSRGTQGPRSTAAAAAAAVGGEDGQVIIRDIELAEVKLGVEHHLNPVEHRKGPGETGLLRAPPPPLDTYSASAAAAVGAGNRRSSIDIPRGHSEVSTATLNTTTIAQVPSSFQSTSAAAWGSCLAGWSAAVEGWRYLGAPENRDVAALVIMKGCGSLTWGAVDILNVKFSENVNMQVGDSSTTLGLIFASVGFGCFLGPVVLNAAVQPRPRPLLWASALAFIFLFAGAVLLAAARRLYMVLVATLVRAVGSATLWIYSTLLLQLRCPNTILGRVSAAEMAFYTICENLSSLYGGAAFDILGMTLEQTTASLAVAAGCVAAGWIAYAWRQQQVLELRSSGSGHSHKDEDMRGMEDELSPLNGE